MCSLVSVFKLFYIILKNMSTNMGENIVFLLIFGTCDVVYNWFISLLPHIVLDNLFWVDWVESQLKPDFTRNKPNVNG